MTTRLNDRDWETISAYLDSELPPDEQIKVQARMDRDEEFKAAYISLLKTRGIMRSVPRIKRRRSFYLTPEMVKPVGWGWLLPTMNYSSIAAGILAFIFLFMDLLPFNEIPVPFQMVKESTALELSTPGQQAAVPAVVIAYTQTSLPPVMEKNMAAEEAPAADQFTQKSETAPLVNETEGAGAVFATFAEPEQFAQPDAPPAQDTAPSTKLEAAGPESVPLQPLTTSTQDEAAMAAPPEENIPSGAAESPASPVIFPTATVMDWIAQPTESDQAMAVEAPAPSSAVELEPQKGVEPTIAHTPVPTGKLSIPTAGMAEIRPATPVIEETRGMTFAQIGGLLLVVSLLLAAGGYILKNRGRS